MDLVKDNSIKKFKCDLCFKNKDSIIWKKELLHYNNKYQNCYLCDSCWEEIDKKFEDEIKNRFDKLKNLFE